MEQPITGKTNKERWAIKGALISTSTIVILILTLGIFDYKIFLFRGWWHLADYAFGAMIGGLLWGTSAAYAHDWLYSRPNAMAAKMPLSPETRVTISVFISFLLLAVVPLLVFEIFNHVEVEQVLLVIMTVVGLIGLAALIKGTFVLLGFAAEQGFIGLAVYVACWIFLFPIMIVCAIIAGLAGLLER